jgi:glycosyltransferase involved in cell wall biosynthesis
VIHVLFLIRALPAHGTERQLVELVKRLDSRRFRITVVTFYPGGALESEIDSLDHVQVLSLNKSGRWDIVGFAVRAFRVARRCRPDVIHGYLTLPNLLALFLGKLTGAKVVWGVRNTYSDLSLQDWLGRLELRVCPWLSSLVDLVIFNSVAARDRHSSLGYRPGRSLTIPNGFDTDTFVSQRDLGTAVRRRCGAVPGDVLIGIIGRLHAQKDHETFFRAAALVAQSHGHLKCLCVGDGDSRYRTRMARIAADLGIAPRVTWAGATHDMAAVYNAIDILVCCSTEEGLPNVVGEAMACGVPCIASDVGDSARLVNGTGLVVPARNAEALGRAVESLVVDPERRMTLGRAGRRRVLDSYSMDALVGRTADALTELATRSPIGLEAVKLAQK